MFFFQILLFIRFLKTLPWPICIDRFLGTNKQTSRLPALDLFLCGLPSHIGLDGNATADTAAKAALLMPVSNLTLPDSEYFPLIKTHVFNPWQSTWSLCTRNQLHAMGPTVNVMKSFRLPGRDVIIVPSTTTRRTYFLDTRSPVDDGQLPEYSAWPIVDHVLLRCPT
jgi:hypothetical protein